jgi:hypothetical protein
MAQTAEQISLDRELMGKRTLTNRELETLDSFRHHQPTEEQVLRIEFLRTRFQSLAEHVVDNVGEAADRIAGLRLLHEAMMTINKAIVTEQHPPPRATREPAAPPR